MLNGMGNMADDIGRSETIYEETRENRPDENHTSIAWMGYNSPISGGFNPVQPFERLVEFQDGLRTTHQGDGPSHNTVMGHSFGSFVAEAAENPNIGGGLNADSLVLIGAPGASVDNITELSTDTDDIHIVQGDDAWIRYLDRSDTLGEHYGTPPDNNEFFEDQENPDETLGQRLDPEEKTGHSGYFDDEETLDYLGDVATGNGWQEAFRGNRRDRPDRGRAEWEEETGRECEQDLQRALCILLRGVEAPAPRG